MSDAGKVSAEAPIITAPIVQQRGSGSGTHSYCYIVAVTDPQQGIGAQSPQYCVNNEPDLSYRTVWNALSTTTTNLGPSPTFLWYVSEDSAPYRLLAVAAHDSSANDVGQRLGSRFGWPDYLPVSNPDITKNEEFFTTVVTITGSQILLSDPLQSSVQEVTVNHDDTQAIENTILAANAAGGGTVQLDAGTYEIERPSFILVENNSVAYPNFTTNLAYAPWWAGATYLILPNGSHGNLNLQGVGANTVIVTPPGMGAYSPLINLGGYQRPNDPSNPVTRLIQITPTLKGATSVSLRNSSDASTLHVGDDIWLYTGSFGQAYCPDSGSLPGPCHYSELNTVTGINGATIMLAYPTSKQYYDDGGSGFGLVRLPVTPHNIALQHMTINTASPITQTGLVYGLVINDLTMPGPIDHGPFGGGYKRDVTIENSTWSFGVGDASYGAEDEYDQFTNLSLVNNTITGVAAPGAEGPSLMARIDMTEGTSQAQIMLNTFVDTSIYAEQTTDVLISQNKFSNGVVNIGFEYAAGADVNWFRQGQQADKSYLSFASQEAAEVRDNTFSSDATFTPPGIIRVGNFTSATIANNVISYQASNTMPVITTFSGAVTGNQISIPASGASDAVVLVPDESELGPPSAFIVQENTLTANSVWAAVLIPNGGFVDSVPICIQNNNWNITFGVPVLYDPTSTQLSCSADPTTAVMQMRLSSERR